MICCFTRNNHSNKINPISPDKGKGVFQLCVATYHCSVQVMAQEMYICYILGYENHLFRFVAQQHWSNSNEDTFEKATVLRLRST